MSDGYNISHLKITEEEIERNGVSALRNTPNRGTHFGTNDLSASELKARFDQLPKLIIKRFNELLGALAEGKVEFSVEGIPSLSALATSIRDGALGAILTVAPGDERTLAELAIDLDTLSTALEEANTTLATKAEGEALEAVKKDLRRALLSLETKAEESAVQNAVDSLSKRVASKVEGSTLTEVVTSIEAELTALQNSLYKKANASDVNTALSRMESSLAGKANAADVSADVAGLRDALAKKATAANVDAALAERDAEIAKKADKSYVDSQLTGKVSQSDFNAALAARDTEIGKKADISALGALNTEITRLGTSIGGKADAKDTAEALGKKADKTAVEAALADKADKADVDEAVAELEKALGKKADVAAVDAALEAKADKSAVEADLAKKADAATVETMLAEIRTALDGKGDGAAIDAALDEIRSALETKTDGEAVTALIVAEVAKVVGTTKDALDTLEELGKALGNDPNFAATVTDKLTELRTALDTKADAADVAELREDLSEKADAATVEAQLAKKANVAEIEQALAGKADASELAKKANAADVAELREDLSKKADAATVEVQLAEKANVADVTAALAERDAEIEKKADATVVKEELEKKANVTDVDAALAAHDEEITLKASATDVNAALAERDAEIEKKANASDVVTELEDIRTVLRGKASATSLDNAIKNFDEAATALWDSVGNKVDASTLAEKEASLRSAIGAKAAATTVEELSNALSTKASTGALALKANASEIERLDSALADKADTTALAEKANTSDVDSALDAIRAVLDGKADRQTVEAALAEIRAALDGKADADLIKGEVAEIVGESPELLNTLEELAAALGDDPNFAATVLAKITELREELNTKAKAEDVNAALAARDEEIAKKADATETGAALAKKANTSDVDSALAAHFEANAKAFGLTFDTLEELRTALDTKAAKVSRLEKKVKNLEVAANADVSIVDDTVAYSKEIPLGVLPYAEITEVGGRSAVEYPNKFDMDRLCSFPYSNGTLEQTNAYDFYFSYSSFSSTYGWLDTPIALIFPNLEIGKTYTLSYNSVYGQRIGVDGIFGIVGSVTFVLREDSKFCFDLTGHVIEEWEDSGGYLQWTYDDIFFYVMLNEGSVAKPYVHYHETAQIISPVTEIEIVGRNRMPTTYPFLKKDFNGVTFTPGEDGSIVLNGTATRGISNYLFANEAEGNGMEGLRLEPGSYYVSGGDFANAKVLIKTSKDVRINGGFSISAEDDYHDIGYVVYIYIPGGTQFDNAVIRPYLLKGEDVPSKIPPYTRTLIEFPPELPCFGCGNEEHYNRIEWDEEGIPWYVWEIDDANNLFVPPMVDRIDYYGLIASNLIKVESGGKITALNEHKLPVPFTVIYQKDPYYTEGGEA